MFTIGVDEILEEGLDLTWDEEPPSVMAYLQNLSHIDFHLETPLHGRAKVWKAGKSIMIRASVQTTLRLQCVRCLKDFSHPLSSDFDLTLHPLKKAAFQEEMELKADDMEATFFEGEKIHLSEIACEQIFLEIPYTPLCREECQGLCPVCGKDRNVSACHCVQEDLESDFSALKKLKLH
jgi:uncharacterized protein